MNPFVPNASFLYPLKTSENLMVFWCFQRVEKCSLGTNGLVNINNYCTHFIKLAGWQLSRVAIGSMKIFPGGNYPVGSFPRWELSGWDFSGGQFSWVGIVQVELILGRDFFLNEVFRVGIVRWESSVWHSCYLQHQHSYF